MALERRFSQLSKNLKYAPGKEFHVRLAEPYSIDDFFEWFNFGEIFHDVENWQQATISFWVNMKYEMSSRIQHRVFVVEPRDIKYCNLSYVNLNVKVRLKACCFSVSFVYRIVRFGISF